MLAQLHKQIGDQNEKIKLSQILKNATEGQCFGRFMRFSQTTNLGEYGQVILAKPVLEVCVNGLLMLKAGIADGIIPIWCPRLQFKPCELLWK